MLLKTILQTPLEEEDSGLADLLKNVSGYEEACNDDINELIKNDTQVSLLSGKETVEVVKKKKKKVRTNMKMKRKLTMKKKLK